MIRGTEERGDQLGSGHIYLDYQATTPVDKRVLERMTPYFTHSFGNASSQHGFGAEAREAVEKARHEVAELVGASAQDIVFTSGATESNNLAILGLASTVPSGSLFVTCQTEHKSVLEVFWELERRGHRVTYLSVDTQGHIDLDELDRTLDESPALVSLMAANNEIGTLHPIAEVAARCKARDLPFHTDATQVIGKIPIDLTRSEVGLASFSAHKIYGPKGVGALYASREVRHRLAPLLHGGAQERGLRSGTLNVPGCVGFGEACRILIEEGPTEAQRLEDHASFLAVKLEERVAPMAVNGPSERLPGNVNVRIEGVIGDALVAALPDVAIATGSACTSEVPTTSHVLRSIGLSDEEAESSIRLSVGRETTQEEISRAVELIGAAVDTQRSFAGVSA